MEDSKKKKAYPRPPSGYQEESFLATSITGSYKINRVGDSASGNTRKNDYPSSLLNSQMSIYSSSVMNKDTSQIYQQKAQADNRVTSISQSQTVDKSNRLFQKSGVPLENILIGELFRCSILAKVQLPILGHVDVTLILTSFKFIVAIIKGDKVKPTTDPDVIRDLLTIEFAMIASCERTVEKKLNSGSAIEITCKDVRKFVFKFTQEMNDDSFQFMSNIVDLAFSKDIERTPAFAFRKSYDQLESEFKGWSKYDIQYEFMRMKINILPPDTPTSEGGLFRYLCNKDKEYCETYPPLIVVPHGMSKEQVQRCMKFRSRERLPALTYGFFNKQQKGVQKNLIPTTMWRCSQCKTGFTSRSAEDEFMLRLIGDPTSREFHNSASAGVNVHIYDARPYLNAVSNMMAGKGYETSKIYTNCEVFFLDIHNIHKVRESFNKIVSLSLSEDTSKFLTGVDASSWLDHIQTILQGTVRICDSMISGYNVVVHCSDGWDRTSQLVALSQLLLDPYYRTIEGFCVLVEKDWVYFGHQFNYRQGHNQRSPSDENSPVFLQFLDCVHQILNQHPKAFQFNHKLLLDLCRASYNCKFGTFLKNFYQELVYENKILEQTMSVWSWVLSRKKIYENPFYDQKSQDGTLKLDPHPRTISLWKRFFFYYSNCERESDLNDFNSDSILSEHSKIKLKLSMYEKLIGSLNLGSAPQSSEDFDQIQQQIEVAFKQYVPESNVWNSQASRLHSNSENSDLEIIRISP